MSVHVENTPEELESFKGATITEIGVVTDEFGEQEVRMVLRLRRGLAINQSVLAVVGVWQDEEGNGPGYLAYLGGSEAL